MSACGGKCFFYVVEQGDAGQTKIRGSDGKLQEVFRHSVWLRDEKEDKSLRGNLASQAFVASKLRAAWALGTLLFELVFCCCFCDQFWSVFTARSCYLRYLFARDVHLETTT